MYSVPFSAYTGTIHNDRTIRRRTAGKIPGVLPKCIFYPHLKENISVKE
jgi:hypothetical protein